MELDAHTFSQNPYRCRLDWGRRGCREAAGRGDILVIVDTLSFASAAVTAVHHGALVYPCSWEDDPGEIARRVGAEIAGGRGGVPDKGRFSLSPLSYVGVEPGTRVVIASPNGAACSCSARGAHRVFVAALLNAEAAGAAVTRAMEERGRAVTVIACGERWREPAEDGPLRVAIEDYLGAGAVLSYLHGDKSPEARVCEGAFLQARPDLEDLVWECGSGRELRERGLGDDVRHAMQLNVYDSVPVLRGERLERYS